MDKAASVLPLPSPVIAPIGPDLYVVRQPYACHWPGLSIAVAPGFCTDGASIPRLLWRLCGHPFNGRVLAPALVHDALYASEWLDREQSDETFHLLLRRNGVGRFKAWVFLRAVRNAGGAVWAKHTPESIAAARKLVTLYIEAQEE